MIGAADLPGVPEVAETGVTFEANALLKARAVGAATGLPAIADDSGIAVDVLGGVARGLQRPLGRPARRRRGQPRPAARPARRRAGRAPRGAPSSARSRWSCRTAGADHRRGGCRAGSLRQRRGAGGFGYDPVFVAEGQTRTNAELTPAEKDAISHRGLALRAMVPLLAGALAGTA